MRPWRVELDAMDVRDYSGAMPAGRRRKRSGHLTNGRRRFNVAALPPTRAPTVRSRR